MSHVKYPSESRSERSWGMALLGATLLIPGAAGTLALVTVLLNRVSLLQELGSQIALHQFIYEGLWLLFFASLFALGMSLVVSAIRRVTHNVVPGPTLYIMGSSLVVIGLMMVMVGNFLHAAAAISVGALLMIAEWYYDAV